MGAANRGLGIYRAAPRAAIHGVDLQHLSDGRHAGDRFLGEFADAEGQRPRQLAVQINRAAAHARYHPGIFRFLTRQTHQDDVSLGAVRVLQNAENFHPHGLRLGALKHGIGNSVHAGVDFAYRNGFNWLEGLSLGYRRLDDRREEEGDDTG